MRLIVSLARSLARSLAFVRQVIDTFFDGGDKQSGRSKTIQGTLFCHNDTCRDSKAVSSLLANLVGLGPNDVAGHSGACGEVAVVGATGGTGGTPETGEHDVERERVTTSTSPTSATKTKTTTNHHYLSLDFSGESLAAAHKQAEGDGKAHGGSRHTVGAFVFDWSTCTADQFTALIDAMVSVATASRDTLPCVLIGLSDKPNDEVLLKHVEAMCEQLHIPQPITIAEEHSARSVYATLVRAALEPERHIPETPSLIATKQHRRFVARASMYAGVGCVLAAGCFIAYRSYRWNSSSSK